MWHRREVNYLVSAANQTRLDNLLIALTLLGIGALVFLGRHGQFNRPPLGRHAPVSRSRVQFMVLYVAGPILIILLIIFLAGGFSGRFGGYGYGYGHGSVGVLGTVLIVVIVLMVLGRI